MEKLEVGKRVRLVRHTVREHNGKVGTVREPSELAPGQYVVVLDGIPDDQPFSSGILVHPHEVQPEWALEMQFAVRFTDDQDQNRTVKFWAPDAHAALEMAPGTRNKTKRAAFFARVFEVVCCGSRKYPDQA